MCAFASMDVRVYVCEAVYIKTYLYIDMILCAYLCVREGGATCVLAHRCMFICVCANVIYKPHLTNVTVARYCHSSFLFIRLCYILPLAGMR